MIDRTPPDSAYTGAHKPRHAGAEPGQNPGVGVDDHVYFQHDRIGPHVGRVIAHGLHGCTVEDPARQRHQVRWARVLGLKARAVHPMKVVDQGVGGAILEHEDGRRVFVAGELPVPVPATPLDLSSLEDKARMAKALRAVDLDAVLAVLRQRPMRRAAPASGLPLVFKRSAG